CEGSLSTRRRSRRGRLSRPARGSPWPRSLFISRAAATAHLPSFPTRRSSDLVSEAVDSGCSTHFLRARRALCTSGFSFGAFSTRSEEHTSELQSPYDLVCRLLLEKKNISATGARVTRRAQAKAEVFSGNSERK